MALLAVIALGASGVGMSFENALAARGGVPNEVNNRINYCYSFDYIEVPTGQLHTGAGACGETKKSCEENRRQTAATDTTTVRVVRVDESCSKFKEEKQ